MSIIKAHAKLNLFFHITGKRDDGYHFIDSLVTFTEDLYDLIEIGNIPDHSNIIDGEFADLLATEERNLIDVAINNFAGNQHYKYHLTKNIPIGAGLGGGSSDAAMVAKFLNPNITTMELVGIGADLPICYQAHSAFCSGIGEIIELVSLPEIYLVLLNPRKALLTQDVFKYNQIIPNSTIKFTNLIHRRFACSRIKYTLRALTTRIKSVNFNSENGVGSSELVTRSNFNNAEQLIAFLEPLRNDLTVAAMQLMPEIQLMLHSLSQQEGCRIARMSGSGPTCFGIFTNRRQARNAYDQLVTLFPTYWVKYTRSKIYSAPSSCQLLK